MPVITQLPFDNKLISLSVERHRSRSPGIHLSRILKDMLVTAGVQRKHGKPITSDQQHLIFESGFLWENAVCEYINSIENRQQEMDAFISMFGLEEQRKKDIEDAKGDIVRPGECTLDGIHMTPDGMNLRLWYLHEWKSTGIRSKGFSIEEKRIEWIWQVASYCKVLGLTRAIIRVFHTGEIPQTVTQWVLDFTSDELDRNWSNILAHYKGMRKAGRAV